ncbi:MAG: 1,4-alpha-glucan branching enzyme [Desulfocapsa sp.]|nr:MAG: 1,4-alpha-glucan branching enzyme [Desulfocapsa sp.]
MDINKQVDRLLRAEHYDPFQVLGVHFTSSDDKKAIVRCFQPHAASVSLVIDKHSLPMAKIRDEGLFEVAIEIDTIADKNLDPYNYQYEITYFDGIQQLINDPYRFMPILGEQDKYLFNFGTNYLLYNQMGAQPGMYSKITGTIFRVWAPSATRVSVVGNFNSWDGRVHALRSLGNSGIWELFIPGIAENEIYKFEIRTQRGDVLLKSDPFQYFGEHRPKTASMVRYLDHYQWQDEQWQEKKQHTVPYDKAMSIYEVHPGSWQRDPKNPERFLTFRELADKLIPYVKQLGFTHIELMPVMEHPLDESWGYQVTGPFSLTSRYGVPEDFMFFVDACHHEDIGVILDWVPAHFPKDSHSLGKFDGTALYEHDDPRKGSHPEWGTFIYNYGRKEVSNFLIANALFWIDKYHIDGLRVDAVASMLYLDYSRKEGEWLPNAYGGRENLEAIDFIRHLNSVVYDRHPGTLMIAEESTSFYGVSKPADMGGLGFGFKWNMGWMNDTLNYFEKDPIYRKFHHNNLTFSIMYAFSENFILPLSHDEVVHGKRSLIDKMPGDLGQKFANLRLLFLSMWMHPGKKLVFMGSEFGQWKEWNCKQSLDFHLFEDNGMHAEMLQFFAKLNTMYRENASLFELDFSHEGFQWMDLEDRENSIISYARFAKSRNDHLVCLLNFTPQTFYDYKMGLPTDSNYEQIFCSDTSRFGGSISCDKVIYKAIHQAYAQAQYHTRVTVPPLSGIVLKPC